ncbi:hypothetical protein J4Q44_G00254790 [Coregonus suidteri]|uniref:Uncharacterized protein n=1 Tax=Coregonus suidteri TaxID=861788 RepID=A0AAN8QNY2_9TELE
MRLWPRSRLTTLQTHDLTMSGWVFNMSANHILRYIYIYSNLMTTAQSLTLVDAVQHLQCSLPGPRPMTNQRLLGWGHVGWGTFDRNGEGLNYVVMSPGYFTIFISCFSENFYRGLW